MTSPLILGISERIHCVTVEDTPPVEALKMQELRAVPSGPGTSSPVSFLQAHLWPTPAHGELASRLARLTVTERHCKYIAHA